MTLVGIDNFLVHDVLCLLWVDHHLILWSLFFFYLASCSLVFQDDVEYIHTREHGVVMLSEEAWDVASYDPRHPAAGCSEGLAIICYIHGGFFDQLFCC